MESLTDVPRQCNHFADKARSFHNTFTNLASLAHRASETHEVAIAGFRKPDDVLAQLARKARADLAAAELAIGTRSFRADWSRFVAGVEELLASIEAAPLLSACPK